MVLSPYAAGIFCDNCGDRVVVDVIVEWTDDTPADNRFDLARDQLVQHAGWACDETGDICPNCQPDAGSETEPRGIAAGTARRRTITTVNLPGDASQEQK